MWIFVVVTFLIGADYPGVHRQEFKFETEAACVLVHSVIAPKLLKDGNIIITQCRFQNT